MRAIKMDTKSILLCAIVLLVVARGAAMAQEGAKNEAADQHADLAQKLQNPVAAIINLPIENNWDFGIGNARAMTYTANFKPVIPFSLNRDWNLITRTIVPVMYAESPDKGGPSKAGLGDIKATVYFSPNKPVEGGFWGLGPGLILPTATDGTLGSEKWSGGPTGAVVRVVGNWTFFLVAAHAWSFAGNSNRSEVNSTFLTPQASYTTEKNTTFGVNSQSAYDWVATKWTVPLEFSVTQLLKIGNQQVSLSVAWRTYIERPEGGPNWGLGFTATFVFPK